MYYSSTKLMNSSEDTMKDYCGLDPAASVKWQKYFYDLHFGLNHYTIRCLISELIPAGTIILFNSCIIYHLTKMSCHLRRANVDKRRNERRQTTSWMNIVLILHSFLFFLSLLSHIIGHFLSIEAHETWWILLAVLGNCSLNFYVYCLSGKTFRQEISRFIQRLTTPILYKIQSHQQHRRNFQEEDFIYRFYQVPNTGQIRTYRSSNDQGSLQIDSSF